MQKEEALVLIEKQFEIAKEIKRSVRHSMVIYAIGSTFMRRITKEDVLKYAIKALDLDRAIHNKKIHPGTVNIQCSF